jgi:hypothetical protein
MRTACFLCCKATLWSARSLRAWSHANPGTADEPPGRGAVDDRARFRRPGPVLFKFRVALLAHLLQFVLHPRPDALEVDCDDLVERLFGLVGGVRSREHDAGALLNASPRLPKVVGPDGAGAVDERGGSSAEGAHAGEYRVHGGRCSQGGELERRAQFFGVVSRTGRRYSLDGIGL